MSRIPALVIGVHLLAATTVLAGSREISLPALFGDYATSGSNEGAKHTGIAFETPMANAVNARLHLRGVCHTGLAACPEEPGTWSWMGEFSVSLHRPGQSDGLYSGFWPEAPSGEFDLLTADFIRDSWDDPAILHGDALAVDLAFGIPGYECSLNGDWIPPDYVSPSTATVTYAALIIDTPVPIEAATWGAVKSLYRP